MMPVAARQALDAAYREYGRRVLATLIRLLGGFDAAEEALHDAFAAAAEQWQREGVPANPYAWLVSAGRFRTIDRWRRQRRLADALPELAALAEPESPMHDIIADDELRLILTCCHPALPQDARIALTLREVGGLTTEEIARAYLAPAPTIAQRIVRAKAKIRDQAIPYEIPERSDLPARLESVLSVIYLIFNEGHAATEGSNLTRADLCAEAIRLGRLVIGLVDAPEGLGLLALMLLHEARRPTRTDAAGTIVLLENQDRSAWDRAAIAEARALVECARKSQRLGRYVLQAAIAVVHVEATTFDQTDWPQIIALYDALLRVDPSSVVELNRAVAVGAARGWAAGLAAVDAAMATGELDNYHLAHAARADMLRRLGFGEAAVVAYRRALTHARQPTERQFLQGRLDALVQQQPSR
jgi:RNA polymerase sigma-70 factor, ECF subfamily